MLFLTTMKFLIAGLGNIGSEYADTRHNIGFMVVDRLAEMLETTLVPDRLASSALGKYRGKQLVLIQPATYMNLSGKAIRFHLDKHQITPDRLIVITDDIALPFGQMRLRMKGSDGGHNGLKSTEELLKTQDYPRIRFGVGNDFPKGAQADYVLSPFSSSEKEALPALIQRCADGVLSMTVQGIERAMSSFNAKPAPQKPSSADSSASG